MGGSNFGYGKVKSLYKHSGRYRPTLKKIVSKALGHSSFLLMCAGSGALFLSNILTKRYLSPQDYLFLSYFITITTILSSFALGGMEQLIIRYCKHTNNTIEIDKTSLISIIAAMTISLIASPLITTTLLPSSLAAPWILLLTLSFSLSLINYNVARVRSGFVEAQISSGTWKFAAFFGVLVCCVKLSDNLQTTLLVGMVLAGALNIYLIKKNISSLVVVKARSSTISTGLAFSFSLAIMTILGTFDRVLAEKLSGQALFAEYVYFSMILIFPFNMIASYVGFREAIFFKNNFSANLIKRKAWNLFLKITIIFIIFGGAVYSLSPLINLKVTWINMILSYVLVCTKCIYSIFSSVMGSRASAKEIWTSNLYSAAAIIAITATFIALDNNITINSLLALFIILWSSRTIIFTNTVLSKQHA
ncbi:hypothetical protein D3C75_489900 [compost metagenome]